MGADLVGGPTRRHAAERFPAVLVHLPGVSGGSAPDPRGDAGAAIGAVGITALLWAAGLLAGSFANNVAAAVFGGTLIIMLYFNLFATLILMVAAWMATDASMEPEPTPIELAERSAQGPTDYATKELVAIMRARQEQESAATVPRGSAVTAARVSGGVGAALGVAVAGGVAVVAALISGLLDRRR